MRVEGLTLSRLHESPDGKQAPTPDDHFDLITVPSLPYQLPPCLLVVHFAKTDGESHVAEFSFIDPDGEKGGSARIEVPASGQPSTSDVVPFRVIIPVPKLAVSKVGEHALALVLDGQTSHRSAFRVVVDPGSPLNLGRLEPPPG